MSSKQLIEQWFDKWEKGDFLDLPISDDFTHKSPFGIITGKEAYVAMVKENQDKFLGYTFTIHDGIYEKEKACVQYTAKQGKDFSLDVSEWYYIQDDLIEEIVAYYHIGDIQEDRQIENYEK